MNDERSNIKAVRAGQSRRHIPCRLLKTSAGGQSVWRPVLFRNFADDSPEGSAECSLGRQPALLYTSSERPRACPVEFHARIYTRGRPGLPAFPRVGPQAAEGGLRADTDGGDAAVFDLETNVKLQGASPWHLTKRPGSTTDVAPSGLYDEETDAIPGAYAPGYTLSPLRGWAIVRQRGRCSSLLQCDTISQNPRRRAAVAEQKWPLVQGSICAREAESCQIRLTATVRVRSDKRGNPNRPLAWGVCAVAAGNAPRLPNGE